MKLQSRKITNGKKSQSAKHLEFHEVDESDTGKLLELSAKPLANVDLARFMLQRGGFNTKETGKIAGNQLSPRMVLQNVHPVTVSLMVKYIVKDV